MARGYRRTAHTGIGTGTGIRTRSNPCRCKVVGPTAGILACAVAGLVEWPVGALVYVFRHMKGRRIMSHPVNVVYPRVARAIPI